MLDLFDTRRYLIPFRGSLLPQVFTDTLVIGGGAAGLRAAIEAATHGDVIMLCKQGVPDSASAWAQGGVASVTTKDDTFEAHIDDTMTAGAGLCDAEIVKCVVEHAPRAMDDLMAWGARFDRTESGELQLGREGGHRSSRIIHADGDATGEEVIRCLWEKARTVEALRIFEDCFALDLLTPSVAPGAPVMGAITHHARYGLQMIWAKSVILATGGAGMVWRETTNPPVATGDGVAMAVRAGAGVADMCFMQFHPTTLYIAGATRALISEAVRGEGAYLVDRSGRRFMQDVHELAELAPRDIVSRAIHAELSRTGDTNVLLDARHLDGFKARFPGIHRLLGRFDLDPTQDLIPVQPAAHYMVGGVHTDDRGRTNVPGLYAVGEIASTGLHGANRLASNSLLEGLVLGERAGAASVEMRSADSGWSVAPPPAPVQIISSIPLSDHGELDLSDVRSSLRSVMWRNVGVERTGAKLRDVTEMIDFWARYTLDKIFDDPQGWETQNMLLVAALIAQSAVWREESRGCHYRSDFPKVHDRFAVHDFWQAGVNAPSEIPLKAAASTP